MTSGIYAIIFNEDLVYVGKSANIEKRVQNHIALLEKGKHKNYKVQAAYNKYSSTLKWIILEEHTGEGILDKEKSWIEEFNTEGLGLNLSGKEETARDVGFKTRGQKEPILISPEGQPYKLTSLAKFCRAFPELDMGALHRVINEAYNRRRHKGWTLAKVQEPEFFEKLIVI